MPTEAHPRIPDLSSEAIELTRDLIRVNTSNPPGNETAAAIVLRDWLASHGVDAELCGPAPDRANLVASLNGSESGPSLALCGHLDVVPAPDGDSTRPDDPGIWTHPPFAAHVDAAGMLWGRGAVDMKSQVASRAAAFAALANSDLARPSTIRLIAQADEEVNAGDQGMAWIVHHRRDLRTDFAVEEGGGRRITLADGRSVVFYGVGDKASIGLRLTAHGRGGHGSVPTRSDNPVPRLGRLLAATDAAVPRRHLVDAARSMLATLAGHSIGAPDELLAQAQHQAPAIAPWLDAITRATLNPTMLEASTSINVVPGDASVVFDCRLLPGQTIEDALAELDHLLAGADTHADTWSIEPLQATPLGGSQSPHESPLADACRAALAPLDPEAILVPALNPYFTDAHHLRSEWDTTTYGIWPWRHTAHADYDAGIHAVDERVHVDDITYATRFHTNLLADWCVRNSRAQLSS